jgi:hypothetical protein
VELEVVEVVEVVVEVVELVPWIPVVPMVLHLEPIMRKSYPVSILENLGDLEARRRVRRRPVGTGSAGGTPVLVLLLQAFGGSRSNFNSGGSKGAMAGINPRLPDPPNLGSSLVGNRDTRRHYTHARTRRRQNRLMELLPEEQRTAS